MKYFPFFMELSKQSVLLIGGGEVAERKLDLLLKANANVTNISIEYPISSAKYSIPEPLRFTVKGLTAPDFIYYKN